jgi:adhesin transport system membrane fusion protein
MADADLDFANDPRAVVESAVAPGAWRILIVIATLFVVLVLWASVARVDQMASGIGRIIPSSQVQLVQSLEPGIVAEILVREGDIVQAGQNLVRIDDTGVSSQLGELRQQQLALSAELDRLNAQARGEETYAPAGPSDPASAPFQRDQQAVFLADKRKLDEQILVRQQQLLQRRQNLREAEATAEKQAASLVLSERELELTETLFDRKAVPELEFIRIQREVAELRADLRIWEAARLRLEAEVAEAEAQIEAERSAFLAEVQARISKVNAEMSVVVESLRAADDRVRRAMLKAPVSGVVNNVAVSSIGEVIAAGANVVEIVPVDDRLLVETRIRPQDVAFIHHGADATVRLTAYDYTKYGTLHGVVERIGADTITDEEGDTYYQVIVSTETEGQGMSGGMRIIPGMVATVDISNGERTVLEYLLKPVLKIRDQALREAR